MKSFDYTITDPVGLHARPAGILVKEVKKYASTVTITKGEKTVNALKLMAIMGMVQAYNSSTEELPLIGKIHILS